MAYEYDRHGKVVKATDQEGNATNYAYDNNGNVTTITSALGASANIGYDALNRQCVVTEPNVLVS